MPTKFSWTDAKGKHFYLASNKTLEGGEAIIQFGYLLNTKGEPVGNERVFRKIKPKGMVTPEECKEMLKQEILVSRILYPDTSELLEFDDGLIGYSMELIPGKNLVKKPNSEYTSLLIHKNPEKELDDLKIEDKQLVLSEKSIHWIEDGKIKSYDLENFKKISKLQSKALTTLFEENKNGTSIPMHEGRHKQLMTELQLAAYCRESNGFNYSDFQHANLIFLHRCQIIRDILNQLYTLHNSNYVHGDINPTNINFYVDKENNAHGKLFDFGHSVSLGKDQFQEDYQVSIMQQFIPPEAAGELPTYGQASDMHSMGGIIGMLLLKNPNDFIQSRLLKGDELEKEDAKKSKIIDELANVKYDLGNLKKMKFDIADSQRKELLTFMEEITSDNPLERPTSQEAFHFFDKLIKIELKKIAELKEFRNNRFDQINSQLDTTVTFSLKQALAKKSHQIIYSNDVQETKKQKLSLELDRFETFCKALYQHKNIPHSALAILDSYQNGDAQFTAPEMPDTLVTIHLTTSPIEEEAKITPKKALSAATENSIRAIEQANNIGALYTALQYWATEALHYQTHKSRNKLTSSVLKGMFSRKEANQTHMDINELLNLLSKHGDISKKSNSNISLETAFYALRESNATVILQLFKVLSAYKEKLTFLSKPNKLSQSI